MKDGKGNGPGTLLIVDDEAEIREIIAMNVAPLGYQVLEAADGAAALEVVRSRSVDIVLSDLMMPRVSGLALLTELRRTGSHQPFIFLTAYPSQDSTLQALRLGAFDYIEKPFEGEELRALLSEAMRVSRAMRALGKDQGHGPEARAAEEIQKLSTLRYREGSAAGAREAGAYAKLANLLVTEATPQLLFAEAAIKGLLEPEERASELGYLFRVMQGVATAAESIGAKTIGEIARAAERFYTALRVRPRALTPELAELAVRANQALQQAVANLGSGGGETGAAVEVTLELQRAADELENAGTRLVG
jgi:DNA-binding response OmpR family regulator